MTPPRSWESLEWMFGRVLAAGVTASAALLAAGLALQVGAGPSALSSGLLHAGLMVLLATPGARVLVACVAFVAAREWLFAAATIAVLAVLGLSAGLALATSW